MKDENQKSCTAMDEKDSIEIARENLRIAAAMRRLNLSEVSRRAGMSRNGLGQFVGGRTTLSYRNMLAVCRVLSIPIGIVHVPSSMTRQRIAAGRALEQLNDPYVDPA